MDLVLENEYYIKKKKVDFDFAVGANETALYGSSILLQNKLI